MTPTGETCGAGPQNTTDPPPKDETQRKLCGGGSCYDSAAGKWCAVDGSGGQVCVSKDAAKQGACASSGDTTLCAGNPAPKPPNPPISDPASQITSSDKYTSQKDNGPVDSTTVNNYNNTGNKPNPGTQPGDVDGKGDKPDDKKKDDGTTASGGGDCNTPPMVEGSAALGLIARQEWELRCGMPEWARVKDGDGDGYKVSDTSKGDVFSTQTDGLDKIDRTSWAGSACPALPNLQVFGKPWLSDQDFFCRWLRVIRYALMFAGAFTAACILAAGGKS
ncbi:hypothetical protein [Dyella sp. ASV21]|uniref:hypothetical protein n=1 Tax=Dyella sp. ASV21 TaxID=2795114 RepID=UPI0018EC9495|nr:hypothetical protein [Dyella sp. ASV21]